MKRIRIKMPDGAVFELLAEEVATMIGKYYENLYRHTGGLFEKHFNDAMNSDDRLLRWIRQGRSWEIYRGLAKQISPPTPPDYMELFNDAELEVVNE